MTLQWLSSCDATPRWRTICPFTPKASFPKDGTEWPTQITPKPRTQNESYTSAVPAVSNPESFAGRVSSVVRDSGLRDHQANSGPRLSLCPSYHHPIFFAGCVGFCISFIIRQREQAAQQESLRLAAI